MTVLCTREMLPVAALRKQMGNFRLREDKKNAGNYRDLFNREGDKCFFIYGYLGI